MTQASAGDSQLLLNILRARDNIPVHFTDLSVIHGSIQMSASAGASVPVANVGTNPTTIAPLVNGQSSPSFDVGTLDTQEFTKGMLTPVDPNVIRQLFNQGIDPRLIMLLFFSEYRDEHGRVFVNNTLCVNKYDLRNGECLNKFYAYLREIDRLFANKQLKANVYVGLKPVGGWMSGAWTVSNFPDLSKFDAKQYKLIDRRIYAITEPRLKICYEGPGGRLVPLLDKRGGAEACNSGEAWVPQLERSGGLYPRSPYEILQYLGQVLRFQEEKRANRCITLGADRFDPTERRCDTGEVLFQVNGPVGAPVVATRYGGAWYSVNDRPCNRVRAQNCDYSLQVLAILELLLNFNKSAKDIVAIPRVQVVQ